MSRPAVSAAGRAQDSWSDYLARYHAQSPGITERVLGNAPLPGVGTPYQWLRAALPAEPGSVVDLACGSAPMQPLLADASSYLGVDLSEQELAHAIGAGRGPVVRADALDLPVPDASIDVVVCSMAIMLLRPVEQALAEVARVLRPGGLFATIRPVGTPIRPADLRLVIPLLLGLRHLPEMPQRFSGQRFQRLQANAGMTVVEDRALRFAHPLASPQDARLAVEALYLPHVSPERRIDASRRLLRHAGAGAQIPLAIRRTVATRA